MQPTVIIPTFWTRRQSRAQNRAAALFDHPTPIDEEGTLRDCLRSIEAVRDLGKVVVIVATTEESLDHAAEDRVDEILADFPAIDSFVLGAAEMGSLHRRMEQLEFADMLAGASLSGYGGVRNVGLIAAAVFGSESVVFVDDDQIITDPDFLHVAHEGLGEELPDGRPILAKSGYYTDADGSYRAPVTTAWYDRFWRQTEYYNRAMAIITAPPRVRPSTLAFGGCLALHRDMYCNVPFDPWAVRGEDIDYVINVRMHGGDVFLDDQWSVIHQPPAPPSEAALFKQDVYRFVYTHRKLEFSKSQVDLRQVTAESLMPYPGAFVDSSITWRARMTAGLRALAGIERGANLRIARTAVGEAQNYARDNCERYFAFQRRWPLLLDRLWQDVALHSLFIGERRMDRGAITGRFPVIRAD